VFPPIPQDMHMKRSLLFQSDYANVKKVDVVGASDTPEKNTLDFLMFKAGGVEESDEDDEDDLLDLDF
jgi:hypothetical protein